jgi:hypothetical protein
MLVDVTEANPAAHYFRNAANQRSWTTSMSGLPRKNSEAKLMTPRATMIIRRKKIKPPVFDIKSINPLAVHGDASTGNG